MPIHIEKYSHFLVIRNPPNWVIPYLHEFSKLYTMKTFVKTPGANTLALQPGKVFASRYGREYKLHANQLDHLLAFFRKQGIDGSHFNVTANTPPEGVDVNIPIRDGWVLKDYQVGVVDYVASDDDTATKLVALQTGKGKMQPLDAKIKIPGGWTTMGDVKVGDTVTAKDGTPTRVIGVFPNGVQPIYRVTFADGRSTECGGEHLWRVYYLSASQQWECRVADTHEVTRLILIPNSRVYIDLIDAEEGTDADLPADPYVRGVTLGENHEEPIPEIYLKGSRWQKFALLQGLMDTDGVVHRSDSISYTTTRLRRAHAVADLVRSLGGFAAVGIGSIYRYRDGEVYYKIDIRYREPSELFRLPWKKSQTGDYNLCAETLKLRVAKIDYIGEKEAQCISIEHPEHLYVTDDYIVTHNTFCSLAAISRLGKRTAVVILPTYIEKWCSDISKILNIDAKDIMVVQGSSHLKGLISLAQDGGFYSPFVIISSRTLQNFITGFESEDGEQITEDYGIRPDELWPLLGIGTLLIDETHQHIHAMFKMLLHSHVKRLIGLTATLISDNYTVEKIHKVMYPVETRYNNLEFDRYIHVFAISYPTSDIRAAKLRTSEWGSNVYSHNAYERSILSKPHLASNYLKIIDYLVLTGYVEEHMAGDKLAIFASSIAMCDKIVGYLKYKYPQYDIRRYCEADPYENVIDADIRVTTIISSGTAIDIPGLRTVILTNSIASSVSNLQVLGRLRKLPDREVKFYYLYNEHIPKQVDYHRRKMELIRDKSASIKELRSPVSL